MKNLFSMGSPADNNLIINFSPPKEKSAYGPDRFSFSMDPAVAVPTFAGGGRLILCQSNVSSDELREKYPGVAITPLGEWAGGNLYGKELSKTNCQREYLRFPQSPGDRQACGSAAPSGTMP